MAVFEVVTAGGRYAAVVERGVLARVRDHLPPRHGKVFVVTEKSIWDAHGSVLSGAADHVLFLPGGEENKRLVGIEALAVQMMDCGADRTSVIVAFGGGIVNDMAGFLAAIFMRGIPVFQIPTTLLAQVDASIGGKTGVNLVSGKNLIGSFHQPSAVLIDPSVLDTLSPREYRAGLFEVIKCGVIASPDLFALLDDRRHAVLARDPEVVDHLIAECVRIKAEVVSADERESGVRRTLNFGHTIGHAIEAETAYSRLLHGEAVARGMKGATYLAATEGSLPSKEAARIQELIAHYGPVPETRDIPPRNIFARLVNDKKALQGRVHFVLPVRIGATEVLSDLPPEAVLASIEQALA